MPYTWPGGVGGRAEVGPPVDVPPPIGLVVGQALSKIAKEAAAARRNRVEVTVFIGFI